MPVMAIMDAMAILTVMAIMAVMAIIAILPSSAKPKPQPNFSQPPTDPPTHPLAQESID